MVNRLNPRNFLAIVFLRPKLSYEMGSGQQVSPNQGAGLILADHNFYQSNPVHAHDRSFLQIDAQLCCLDVRGTHTEMC